MEKEESENDGMISVIVDCEIDLKRFIEGNKSGHVEKLVDFGFYKVVLVLSKKVKDKIMIFLKDKICLTIVEAKSSKFNDVIFYSICDDSQVNESYW